MDYVYNKLNDYLANKMMNMSIKKKIKEYAKSESVDINLNFRINKKVKEELDAVAKRNEVSTSLIIRFLINNFLKQQKSD